jgi:hypothetical protein
MQFIGVDGVHAPRLLDAENDIEDFNAVYE